jgi:superfamily II DNA/RNA helicase
LLAVQPRPLGPTDITVRLGANWVPASDIAAFARDVLGNSMEVGYSHLTGTWSINQTSRNVNEWGFNKLDAGDILDAVLNSRQIKITWRDQDGKTHTDVEATEKANDIAGKMRERFRTWVWTDPARADRLVKYYNENFNNIAPRAFDGSHLTLPGVSARFKLYPHQKRAVWRVIQQGDVYLAHAVGAGKTMEMIASGMEERRLGLVKKPMYVVPNHMLAQFSREFLELYPAANIMVADEHNFHSHNRKRFVAQAALNNPDAIVITHSAFGRIAMSDAFAEQFVRYQIAQWEDALKDAEGDRVTTKQIERRIEQLERRLEGKQGKEKKDRVLDFEELGVDKLYVDEFHEFRKLDFATNQGNVKGVDPNGSQRAMDLMMKVQYLRGKNPGRALVAASGTPVTNTMGELFTAQRFFQPAQMKEDGLDSFDAWSAQYGDIVTGFEQNAAGGYEMVARFAKFQNVPELMRRVRSFMDILTSSNLGALVTRPDVVGGGREVVVTPVPDGYKEYQKTLQARIQAIKNRKGPPAKGQDIILNVIGDGRFSAIDMRFVDPSAPSDPNSKLNLWIDAMIQAYRDTAGFEYVNRESGKSDPVKGASIIGFSDIGLGEASAANRGFDMRGWIEKRMTEAGIPIEHVAFMRDFKQHAKKERLFADMREGKKRILIGGKEMETGTNVQKRLTHLFHLDAPWFPASVEQREGRIIRQGNQNKEVTVKAYATKGSYDSTMWGMNARKARFIEQAMNGDDTVRSLDDVSEASAFEMASALASGDERYLRLAGLKADVDKLERLRSAHYDEQNSLRRNKHWAEEGIKRNQARAGEIEEAIAQRTPIKAGEFLAKVGNRPFDSREEFSQALFAEAKTLGDKEFEGEKVIGGIGGFEIKYVGLVSKGSGAYAAGVHVEVPGDHPELISLPIDPQFAVNGIATRAANQVNGLDRDLAEAKKLVEENTRKAEQIGKRLGAPFPEEALLLEKVADLNALQEELAKEGEQANADAAAATVETEGQPEESASEEPKASVGEAPGDLNATTLRQSVTRGVLGPVIAQMIEGGHIVLHDTASTVPGAKPGVQALTTRGNKIHLVADALTANNARAVLLHEAFHAGAEKLIGTPAWEKMLGRLDALSRQGRQSAGRAGEFWQAAKARTEAARKVGAVGQGMTAEEFGAYAIEEYESAPATVRKWVDDLVGMVKAWLMAKFGRQFGDITPAQLSALAKLAILDRAADAREELFGRAGEAFSAGTPTIDVDGVRRPAVNSKGKWLHPTVAGQRAFWRWFGDSKVVDEQGRPLAVYHGTRADFASFDRDAKVANPWLLGHDNKNGFFFTDNPGTRSDSGPWSGAAGYAGAQQREGETVAATGANVMPVYLALQSPYEMTAAQYRDRAARPDFKDELEALGYDGVRIGDGTLIAFSPEQIKSATGNNGDFDPTNPDIRYSVKAESADKAGEAAKPEDRGLTPPEQNLGRRLQAQLQDNMNRVRQVQDRIMKLAGRPVSEAADYYGAEANRPGRIAARKEDAEKKLFAPLMEDLAKAGKTREQLAELLHAMHAQERNEAIARINPDMPDGGSGMTTADAAKTLAKYSGDTALHKLAERARGIAQATLDMKLAYGLIRQEQYDALKEAYEFYVPLKGDGEFGPKVKRAMGHEEREEHILENIARDYEQGVVVGEKNLARQSLLRLVLANPDKELWTVGVPPKGRYIAGVVYSVQKDGKTEATFTWQEQVSAFLEAKGAQAAAYTVVDSNGEQVKTFTKPLQDNEVVVYVQGDPIRMQFHDEALAQQLRPLDQQRMGPILEFMRGMNRYLSKIYTGYNPSFIIRNAVRDAWTGSLNMLGHEGAGVAAKAWLKYPQAVATMGKWAATGKVEGKMATYLNEYRMHGGKVGASWMSDLEQQGKTLERLYDDAYGAGAYLKDGKTGKAALIAGRKIVGGMAHVVEVANQATENALRLSLFATLREQGVSPARAAQAAKSVTVDFDRKGSATGMLGAVYLFFNPAVQGAANAIKTLATGKHKQQAWAAVGALVLLGLWAAGKGMDDDKDRWLGEGWDVRAKNVLLNIGGHQLRLPMSQEFAPAYALGVAMAEASRGESAMRSSLRTLSSFLDAYFPLQGLYSADSDNHALDAALAMTPTIVKPATQIAVNRNNFGSQIYPENEFTKNRPDNLKMYRGTKNTAYDAAAQGVASLGQMLGSGKYENDLSKVSPETLKMLWRQYTGGLGVFVTDVAGLAGMGLSDPAQVETGDWPVLKDFWRTQDVKPIRGRYYDLAREAESAITEFTQAKKAGDGEAIDKLMADPEKSALVSLGRMIRATAKHAGAVRDEEVNINADTSLSPSQKRAELKKLEADEEAIYRGAIESFRK